MFRRARSSGGRETELREIPSVKRHHPALVHPNSGPAGSASKDARLVVLRDLLVLFGGVVPPHTIRSMSTRDALASTSQ